MPTATLSPSRTRIGRIGPSSAGMFMAPKEFDAITDYVRANPIGEVIVRGFHDPRISGLITVTNVKVTQDGREAFVGISVYPAEKAQLTVHGLQNAGAYIRREVGDMIRVRVMPQLTFQLDESLKKQAEIIAAFKPREDED